MEPDLLGNTGLPSPRALLFDLDETLLDNRGISQAVAATCEAVAAAFKGLDARTLRRANSDSWSGYWPQVERACWLGHMDGFAVSREVWRRTLQACGCADEAVVRYAVERYLQLSRDAYRLFTDAAELLTRLAGSEIGLAVVTNGPADLQWDKLRSLGIAELFHSVVISGEVGVAKPDSAPFLLALRRLGVRPQDAWHVGDSLATDVAGARAAGLSPVWLNRDGAPTSDGQPSPDLQIDSLATVATILIE